MTRRPQISVLRWALPLALLAVALVLMLSQRRLTEFAQSPFPLPNPLPFDEALAGLDPLPLPAVDGSAIPLRVTMESGDTLGGLLQSTGLEASEASGAILALEEYLDVRRLRPGQAVSYYLGADSRPERLTMRIGDSGKVHLARASEGWATTWTPFERRVETRAIRGELEGALESAIVASGGVGKLSFKMAEVLQWDLDFNRDLRVGDEFEVLFEEVYLDGRYHGLGNVLALSYQNGGRTLEAFRYGSGDGGYYGPDGRPLEKMFLRSPLRYSRVTSRFNLRRFHPVLKKYRPHYGVDYGTPVGTPVRATASGVVTFAGWNKGGGKVVKVRHANRYLTAYLHLSRFAKGVAPGRRVEQGEVIAYSGNTGLSSGPHLDYRVQKNGRWIDPLSLRNVPAQPIAVAELDQFYAWRDRCRDSLERGVGLGSAPLPDTVVAAESAPPPSRSVSTATAGR
ncbi:MAG: peptidoglycan DD-metalloendopeptidase family protein [Acidobacteriota bacterium]